MDVLIIGKQILILLILASIGLIAAKLNIINKEVQKGLSKIIFNITLPFLIITKITSLDIEKTNILDWGVIIIIVLISILFFLLVGYITQKLLKIGKSRSAVHIMHTAFTNAVFLGFPVLDVLFPNGEGILYGIIYFLTQNTTMWTLGIYIFSRDEKNKMINNFKNLLNPNTIAFFIALAMFMAGIKLPDFLHNPFSGLGKTTLYLAMLYTGAILAGINFLALFKERSSFILSFNKLLLAPFLLIFIIKGIFYLIPYDISTTAKIVIVMESAMPCQTLMIILAEQFKKDDLYAIRNFSVSTVLSILTLPLIYFLSVYFI